MVHAAGGGDAPSGPGGGVPGQRARARQAQGAGAPPPRVPAARPSPSCGCRAATPRTGPPAATSASPTQTASTICGAPSSFERVFCQADSRTRAAPLPHPSYPHGGALSAWTTTSCAEASARAVPHHSPFLPPLPPRRHHHRAVTHLVCGCPRLSGTPPTPPRPHCGPIHAWQRN